MQFLKQTFFATKVEILQPRLSNWSMPKYHGIPHSANAISTWLLKYVSYPTID